MVNARSLSLDAGISRAAFLAAFLFALLTSGSLVCERLAHGHSAFSWLCSVAVTAGALVLLASVNTLAAHSRRAVRRSKAVFCAQSLGIAAAIGFVHLALVALGDGEQLVERPAQLVNDLVLAAATLGFAWSLVAPARRLRIFLPVLSFGLLAAYTFTMRCWHFDPFPGLEVQHYVIGQVLSTSAGLLLFHLFGS